MNNKKFTSLLAASSLLLPLGLFAQAGTTGGTTSGSTGASGTSGTSTQSSQYPSTSGTSTSRTPGQSSGQSSEWSRTGSSHMSSSQHQNFRRIKEDKLENKITAERLKGKTVVDRDGQKIGTVKNIGLSAALQSGSDSQWQTSAGSTGAGSTSDTRTAAGRTSGSTSGSSASMGTTANASGSMSATGSIHGTSATASMGGQSGQVELYVELDDAVGVSGDDLAVIPASRVQFDQQKDQLKLQIGRQEFASMLSQSAAAGSVAE